MACVSGVSLERAMSESVMMPTEQSNSARISLARSMGQRRPKAITTSHVTAGRATARISACVSTGFSCREMSSMAVN